MVPFISFFIVSTVVITFAKSCVFPKKMEWNYFHNGTFAKSCAFPKKIGLNYLQIFDYLLENMKMNILPFNSFLTLSTVVCV